MLERFAGLLGPAGLVTDPGLISGYTLDYRKLLQGQTEAVLRPNSTEQVQAIVLLAAEGGYGLVPQGGNTGYVGGATPVGSARQLVLSLERMNRIREVDSLNFTLSCDAGVILADAQAAARQHDLLFPLSPGSEGSCRIGGNIGTNAGGLQVLRYGMMRDLVLGLEVVLPNGKVFSEMRKLRKNNVGYDLKQLLIGAEGTLGVVTGAVLKLWPAQSHRATAWLQLPAGAPLAEIAALVRRETSDLVSTFELMSDASLGLVQDMNAVRSELRGGTGGALLIELSSSSTRVPIETLLLGTLEDLLARDWLEDALVAQTETQRRSMWSIRESIPDAEVHSGGSVKHDISVPISRIGEFLARAEALRSKAPEGARVSYYGHVGDGNVHYNLLVPKWQDRLEFTRAVEAGVALDYYDLAADLGGSFSAEYGIGRFKIDLLHAYIDQTHRELLQGIKSVFDPIGCMNPGVMFRR